MTDGGWTASRRERGFTLPELMIVMVVMGILLGVGIPTYRDTIARTRVTSKMNELVGAMQAARGEAVRRGVDVSVCAVESGVKCGNGSAGSWSTGWAVIAEDPAGTTGAQDASDEVVGRNDIESTTLTYRGWGTATPGLAITYRPNGATRLGAGTNFQLVVCNSSSHGGAITIDATGRPKASTLEGSDLSDQCGSVP